MGARLKKLGVVVAILGLLFVLGGGIAAFKVKQGADSLNGFATAQNVQLTYDEKGNLLIGTPEDTAAILAMLKDDWKYPVNNSELNSKDPLVNTGTEYMVQMATVTYHTLHGKATITLPAGSKDAVYNGKTYHAGDTVDFVNDGRYWTGFDRNNAIEAAARDKIWTATAHALVGELGVGAATASTLQLGYGVAAVTAGLGATLILAGLGLAWAAAAAPAATAAAPAAAATKAEPKAKDKK
jgi:hypothetical protein